MSEDDENMEVLCDKEDKRPENIDKVVTQAIKYCQVHEIDNNPVELLRHLQKVLVVGRALEISSLNDCLEGNVNSIIVDRENILETGLDQLSGLKNLFLTLEVDFYGEVIEQLFL